MTDSKPTNLDGTVSPEAPSHGPPPDSTSDSAPAPPSSGAALASVSGTQTGSAATWIRRLAIAALLALAAWPLLFHVLHLDDYGRMQRDDYYGLLFRLTDGEKFENSVSSFWNARINQHRVTVPALIWRLNVAMTGGDNRVTAYMALGFVFIAFALCLWQALARRTPQDRSSDERPQLWLAAPLLAWALFGPQATYNLAKSFGGVHYFLTDALCVAAMVALLRVTDPARRRFLLLALGLLAILTFSSALAIWPALLVGCLWLRRPWGDLVTVLIGAAASAAIFKIGVGTETAWPSPTTLADYVAVFLGSLPRQEVETSRLIGAAGLLWIAALAVLVWRRRGCGDGVFWLMTAGYAAGNGLLVGLGRADVGLEQASAIRYVLFPGLFWASLLILTLSLLPTGRVATWAGALAVSAIAVIGLRPAALEGLKDSRTSLEAGYWQQVIEAQLRHSAWDPTLVGAAVTRFPPAVLSPRRIALWQQIGHIPFDRPAEALPDRHLDPSRLAEPIEGGFTELVETNHPDIVRVGGWLPRQADIEEVVMADATGRLRSLVHLWRHPKNEDRLKWAGLVLWADEWETWTPFVIDAEGALRPLPPTRNTAALWRELAESRRAGQDREETRPSPDPAPAASPEGPATAQSPPESPPTADPANDAGPPD